MRKIQRKELRLKKLTNHTLVKTQQASVIEQRMLLDLQRALPGLIRLRNRHVNRPDSCMWHHACS